MDSAGAALVDGLQLGVYVMVLVLLVAFHLAAQPSTWPLFAMAMLLVFLAALCKLVEFYAGCCGLLVLCWPSLGPPACWYGGSLPISWRCWSSLGPSTLELTTLSFGHVLWLVFLVAARLGQQVCRHGFLVIAPVFRMAFHTLERQFARIFSPFVMMPFLVAFHLRVLQIMRYFALLVFGQEATAAMALCCAPACACAGGCRRPSSRWPSGGSGI